MIPARMTARARVSAAFDRLDATDRPEAWIALRAREEVLAEAAELDCGPPRPLTGVVLAVKDNIDVVGLPTTAGCPAYAYTPAADAPAVARLRAAGAIVIGKTNLDQFATGLVGTRSPYGAVRDAIRPDRVSGGSSSGSAVVVALGIVDAALGTDTAGSGRVPAALQGVIGIKPTIGLVPTAGVVPACRSFDCVSVFAADAQLGQAVLWTMAGKGSDRAPVRRWPGGAPLAAPLQPRIAVPSGAQLSALTEEGHAAFVAATNRLIEHGATVAEIDLSPFLAAGRLLYGGAFVAERYAAVGRFIDRHPGDVDATVAQIISTASTITASELVADRERLQQLSRESAGALERFDALLMPTVPRQPSVEEALADPIGVNAELGVYTSFANLLDLCAIVLPAGVADGGRFGISLLAPAFGDRVLADLAARFLGSPSRPGVPAAPAGTPLFVVGAHRCGQPLNYQLTDVGARPIEVIETSSDYRLHVLRTEPPKPGLVRVAEGGVAIEGELWEMPPAVLGPFLAALPRPMTLGAVTLADGRSVVGFACEPSALDGTRDISEMGSWPAYLAAE